MAYGISKSRKGHHQGPILPGGVPLSTKKGGFLTKTLSFGFCEASITLWLTRWWRKGSVSHSENISFSTREFLKHGHPQHHDRFNSIHKMFFCCPIWRHSPKNFRHFQEAFVFPACLPASVPAPRRPGSTILTIAPVQNATWQRSWRQWPGSRRCADLGLAMAGTFFPLKKCTYLSLIKQTYGKSPINGGFNGKIVGCHVF